jgi:hypothetical protein
MPVNHPEDDDILLPVGDDAENLDGRPDEDLDDDMDEEAGLPALVDAQQGLRGIMDEEALAASRTYLDQLYDPDGEPAVQDEISDEEAFQRAMQVTAALEGRLLEGHPLKEGAAPEMPDTLRLAAALPAHIREVLGADVDLRWQAIAQLPAYTQNAVRGLGRQAFANLTPAQMEHIQAVAVTQQALQVDGPEAAGFLRLVQWIEDNTRHIRDIEMDFARYMPGGQVAAVMDEAGQVVRQGRELGAYRPQVKLYDAGTYGFVVVRDHVGFYVYAAPNAPQVNLIAAPAQAALPAPEGAVPAPVEPAPAADPAPATREPDHAPTQAEPGRAPLPQVLVAETLRAAGFRFAMAGGLPTYIGEIDGVEVKVQGERSRPINRSRELTITEDGVVSKLPLAEFPEWAERLAASAPKP